MVNLKRSFSAIFIRIAASFPHHIYNIKLKQQGYDTEIGQYADYDFQQKRHYQRIAGKLLHQRDIIAHGKHTDTQPIDEIGRQEISSEQGYRHRATLRHGILKTFAARPTP